MWSYSGNPSSSPLSEVRYLISDTDESKSWSLTDEEISYAIDLYSDHPPVIGRNFRAAAESAQNILTKLMGQLSDKRVGDLSITVNKESLAFYRSNFARLRQLATLQAVQPYSGGMSRSEKRANDADADRVRPALTVDGMSLPSHRNDDGTGNC